MPGLFTENDVEGNRLYLSLIGGFYFKSQLNTMTNTITSKEAPSAYPLLGATFCVHL